MATSQNPDEHGYERLLKSLHIELAELLRPRINNATDIRIQPGVRYQIDTYKDGKLNHEFFMQVSPQMFVETTSRIGKFDPITGRTSIPGTFHRVSKFPPEGSEMDGFKIRVGRYIPGIAEKFKPLLVPPKQETEKGANIVIIGPPNTGKTVLLRDICRICTKYYAQGLTIIDTSNEIGGDDKTPHEIVQDAIRIRHTPKENDDYNQHRIIAKSVRNFSPRMLILDELVDARDIETVAKEGQKGVRIIASIHGWNLHEALNNNLNDPLFGNFNLERSKRIYRPVFDTAIEVIARGKYRIYRNLMKTIDAILNNGAIDFITLDTNDPNAKPIVTRGENAPSL